MAVELSDYMRRVLRWSWLIAVVTVVGGIIALLLTSQNSTVYTTTATVAAPSDVTTAAQSLQYVNDFEAASGSRAVIDAVTEDTNVPRNTIDQRVSVSQVGTSGIIQTSYNTPVNNDPAAEPVIESVVKNTLALMFEARIHDAQQGVDAANKGLQTAQASLDAAQGQVSQFLAARSYDSPLTRLDSINSQISDLELRQTDARAQGQVAEANTYAASIADLQKQRAVVGKDAEAFDLLQGKVDDAKAAVTRAQSAQETASATLAQDQPQGDVTFGRRSEPQDRAATIWRRTLAVMAACFILSVLLVAWLASLTPAGDLQEEPAPAEAAVPLEEEPGDTRKRRPFREPTRDPDGVTVSPQPS